MIKKTKTMIKVWIAILATAIILLGIGAIYIHHNLSTYFIYYAKHIPHTKGTNPEMIVLLENLDTIPLPNVNRIDYEIDNGNNNITKDKYINLILSSEGAEIHFLKYGKENNFKNQLYRTYFFSQSGKFEKYYYQDGLSNKNVYDKSGKSNNQAQEYVDEVINPIVDKMEVKPKVNLQWLFNKKYQERFSNE